MRSLILTAATLAALVTLTGCEDEFKTACENQGGVMKEDTKVFVTNGIDSKGKPTFGTTTTTIKFCVVDGKIVATQ